MSVARSARGVSPHSRGGVPESSSLVMVPVVVPLVELELVPSHVVNPWVVEVPEAPVATSVPSEE